MGGPVRRPLSNVADIDTTVTESAEEEETRAEQAARFRREESTVLEVSEASVSGQYLCCKCGFTFENAGYARHHEWREHIPDEAKQNEYGRQNAHRVQDVPDAYIEPRWVVLYDSVGREWTHPKEVETKKQRICRVL